MKGANEDPLFAFADYFSIIVKDDFESRFIIRVHTYGSGDGLGIQEMLQFCYLEPIDKSVDVTVSHHFDRLNSSTIWSSVVKTDKIGTTGVNSTMDGSGGLFVQFRWKFEDANQDYIYIPDDGPTSYLEVMSRFNAAKIKRNEMKENTSVRLAYRYVNANATYVSDCDGGRFDLNLFTTSISGPINGADYYNLGRPKYGSRPRDANSCSVYDNQAGAYALACLIYNGQSWKAFDHNYTAILNSAQLDGVWYKNYNW